MGSSVGPLLANIIMTEMDKTIIKNFNDHKILLFDRRFVTLVAITSDIFDHVVHHFLDIEIYPDRLSNYCKDTNKGQYTHYNSFSQ